MSNAALTQGVHHVGLTVRELYATRDFFVNCLGWSQVGEKPDYPAVFVFDGYILVTLWKVKDQAHMREFDRRSNVGLHHLALRAKSEEAFREIVKRVERWSGVRIEFPPEPLSGSPITHTMVYEPSGVRIEFDFVPGR